MREVDAIEHVHPAAAPVRDRDADEIAEAVDRATRRLLHAAGVETRSPGARDDVRCRSRARSTSLRRKPNVCAMTSGTWRLLPAVLRYWLNSAAPGRWVSANQRLAPAGARDARAQSPRHRRRPGSRRPSRAPSSMARAGKPATCLMRQKRSSSSAATSAPSRSTAAATSP